MKTKFLCLAREISLGVVTKPDRIYQGPAHSTVVTSLLVVDEVQTLGQLCPMPPYRHWLRAAKPAALTNSTKDQTSLCVRLNHPRHIHCGRSLHYTDVGDRRIQP